VKKKKLKKKELAVRIKRLVDQFSDLNNRLNRVSHDKLNQSLQLDQLSDDNAGVQQRLHEMQEQIGRLISQEEALSSLLGSLQLQTQDETVAEEISPEQHEIQRKLDDLNAQLATLNEQHQSFRHALEDDSQSADTLANDTDDLRRDVADLLAHIRHLEENGSELLVSGSKHESEIRRLQNDIAELNQKLEQSQSERDSSQQEVNRLLQENAEPLQREIEHLRKQLSENGGQQKALEHRLLELANRIGETGARLERHLPEQQKTQQNLDDLNEQLAALHEQHQTFRHTLEHDSQSADILANITDDLRRDVADLHSHMRRLEESGSELLVCDAQHKTQILRLQNDIGELGRKLEQNLSERESPQQEVSQLLLESVHPLQHDIEYLKHQYSDNSGQHKALEHRLLELANRIGETGARLEGLQQDKVRKSEVLEQRLANLENLVQGLQPVSNADASQLAELEQKLSQAEGDMSSLLADKSRELTARADSLDAALNEQAAKSESLHDQINQFNDDLAGRSRGLEERLTAIDHRLSGHIDQQADLPDPLASIAPAIEAQKERFEETTRQLKQEISGLSEKLQVLDTNEREAADWLSSLAANIDQHAEDKGKIQEELAGAKSDFNRRFDGIKARLIITERQLKEQEEAAQDQLQKLANVAEEMAQQHRKSADLKLATASLQEDSSQLKESNSELNERIENLQRMLQEGEEKQTQITQQLSEVEQAQKEQRELSEAGMDSLQERVKTALAHLAEHTGLNEGLTQRLNDLESSLQAQFSDLDNRHHQIFVTESENQERLTNHEQSNQALSLLITELKTDHQGLLEQSDKQKAFLEAMTSEYGKRQEEAEQMTARLDLLGTQVESSRSSGTYHSFAIGGLFLLLLLSILFGYQYLTGKLGNVERNFSLGLMNVSENHMTKNEIEQLMSVTAARMESANDSQAVEELIEQQDDFEQRLGEIEQQISISTGTAADQTTPPKLINESVTAKQQQPQPAPLKTSHEGTVTDLKPQQTTAHEDSWQALRKRGGYTIQLIGVANKDSISSFATKYGLQGDLAYITTEREGKAWHILLYGMYDSYAEATKALQNLPESLISQQPWARKMPGLGTISRL
jgi:chromosome segregation ATPase